MRGRLYGSTTKGAVHGSTRKHRRCPATLEQGQARLSEDPLQAERDLGHSPSAAARGSAQGTPPVQSGHRHQTTSLRSSEAQSARCLSRPKGSLSYDRAAAEDSEACSVRDYRADTGGCWGLDRSGGTVPGKQSLSKPTARLNAPVHPAVRADFGFLGQAARIGHGEPRDAYAQADG